MLSCGCVILYIPGREDEGGGEELGLLLDGHIDGLDRLPGRAVPDHHPPVVAVTLPPPPVLHRLHRVCLPPALRVLLLSRVERYSTFWRFLKAGTMLLINYIFMHPIQFPVSVAELGTRQQCLDNVTMFSGLRTVYHDNMTIFVVATPHRHEAIKFVVLFLSLKLHYVVAKFNNCCVPSRVE